MEFAAIGQGAIDAQALSQSRVASLLALSPSKRSCAYGQPISFVFTVANCRLQRVGKSVRCLFKSEFCRCLCGQQCSFCCLGYALDDIHRFHPTQFSGSGSQGMYLVSAFDRNWQNISVWSSANCLPIELVPEAAAESPCVLVEILNSSDISENLVFRVSALGIGSVAQTHVVVQAWVYQYRPAGEAGEADEVTEWITELRGLKVL